MLQSPRIKPHLRIEVVKGVGVFVLSEYRQIVLQGRLYELVMPALDGRPIEDVCRQLAAQAKPAEVFYTLRNLEQKGLVCESGAVTNAGVDALWSIQNIEPAVARERLSQTAVSIEPLGVDDSPLRKLLANLGVQVHKDGQFRVVVANHYLHRGIRVYNTEALASGQAWMLAKPTGSMIWIGPVFRPGETACWECLAQRMRSNYPVVGYLDSVWEEGQLPETDSVQSSATLSAAWGTIATTIANWIVRDGHMPDLNGKLQTFNLLNLKSESHHVLKQHTCPACGVSSEPAVVELAPLVLHSRKKIYTEDGGHRSVSPQQTLDKYSHLVSPICGAVSMLERTAPADDETMHVFVSGNNIARGPQSLFSLKTDLRSLSAGKGINELQAKASALCEGLERYSGVFRGDEPRRLARLVDLNESAIHPNRCMLFSDLQYRERDERNAKSSVYGYIPLPFETETEVDWTPVWSLTREAVRYLPTDFCFFNYPTDCHQDFCVDCSNGNSAGNSLEEAILQGFFELAERDAVAVWWYNRVQVPEVDLDSFDEPYLGRLQLYLQKRNRDLWCLDLTNDLGIPVFAALSRRTDGPTEHIMFGFGAHFDPRIALLRAVTELNQMLVPILDTPAGSPPANLSDKDTVHWLQTATVADHSYLAGSGQSVSTASSFPHCWTDDLKSDILICKSRVEELGLEMLVLNQTRAEIGMPVVKVIVPGLRHFWSRFAPGRLYDVPVKLGWLDKPRTEEELNPMPMFL